MVGKRSFLLILAMMVLCVAMQAQEPVEDLPENATPVMAPRVKVGSAFLDGDSIQQVELNTLYVYSEPIFKNEKERQKYNRLVENVKKVLPIAKTVNKVVIEAYEVLMLFDTEKERAEHMKRMEKDVKRQYTPIMKKLTYQQGKLLIKLIYRETNSSSYQLINAFLGPMKAAFYQAFAALFGASLMKEYDPEGADKVTERIVRMVEAGQI